MILPCRTFQFHESSLACADQRTQAYTATKVTEKPQNGDKECIQDFTGIFWPEAGFDK